MLKKLFKRPWRLFFIVLMLLLLAGGVYKIWFAKPAAPEIITAPVVRGDVQDTVLASGTVQAGKLINVGAQVSGQVTKLYIAMGDMVKKGQLIAEVDATTQHNKLQDAQAALQAARASYTTKQSALQQAQIEFTRQKYMLAHDATSKMQYEKARQDLVLAQSEVTSAKANIEQRQLSVRTAQVDVGYTRIVAPMDGTVVAVVTEAGQTMNANQSAPTIVKLAQLNPMQIQAQISEADVLRVKAGMQASFTLLGNADKSYPARLRSIELGPLDINTYSGRATSSDSGKAVYYNGLLEAPNPNGDLRIQMTAQVRIVLGEAKNVLTIPSAALHKRQENANQKIGSNYTVYVHKINGNDESSIEQRDVRIGLNNRITAEVLDGLQEGEAVVLGDASNLNKSVSHKRGSF